MATKLGGNVEACSVCGDKVYPLDKFVIEKLVMHKSCFKCKHCDRKLSLTNFAAVNSTVYCKVHYLKLFKESGGKYDKAFGDGGFQKKSNASYTPGQFQGVGKALPSHVTAGAAPQMSPVITTKAKQIAVKKLEDEDDEQNTDDAGTGDDEAAEQSLQDSPPIELNKSSVKDFLRIFESSLPDTSSVDTDSQSSPVPSKTRRTADSSRAVNLQGNADLSQKWLSGVASQHIKKHAEVDHHAGGSVSERKAAYLASAGTADSPPQKAPGDRSLDKSPLNLTPPSRGVEATDSLERDKPSLHGNLQNRLEWSKNLGTQHVKSHTEIDRSSGGTAQDRTEAYLAAISASSSPGSDKGSNKKISKLISEKVKAFSSPPSASNSPGSNSSKLAENESPSPGAVSARVREFTESLGHSGKESSSAPVFSIGKIDDRLQAFQEAAKQARSGGSRKAEGGGDESGGENNEEEMSHSQPLKSPSGSKSEAGQGGAPIRSFNEGASGSLRRTPSWLRQQRALQQQEQEPPSQEEVREPSRDEEEESKSFSAADEPPSTPEKEGPNKEEGEEYAGEEPPPSTPPADESQPATPPSGSIMKRTGSWKKDKSTTPAEKRVVRFGVAEIHELPSSPKTPDVGASLLDAPTTPESSSSGSVRAGVGGHTAPKGSALAMYLKYSGGGSASRKRSYEAPESEEVSSAQHSDSPPPPVLSPGSTRSPSSFSSSHLPHVFVKENVLGSLDEPSLTADDGAAAASEEDGATPPVTTAQEEEEEAAVTDTANEEEQ